ncbi:MAG TPA: VTT domain-containing protein [Terriglobales bacterium]|jgi:membrane protein YqaA with SNARE-associated domain|nr:VTT domain-containing protein [Terriglobales bacterium]
MHWLAIVLLASKKSALRWLIHLGGPSLILLGLVDNSVIPLPGSTDIVTILLAAHHREPWVYYAIMATVGAILGGYLTYRMARKGGKETLEKRFSKKKTDKVYAIFSRWGFAAVAIPALLPPPFPIVPMLLAAGAMQYPTRKFLTALAVGRGIRFTILAYLGFHYGRHIVNFFARYYWPVLIALIAFSVVGGLYGLFEYKRRQKNSTPKPARPKVQPRQRTA